MNEPSQLDRIENSLKLLLTIHTSRTRKPRQRMVSDDRPSEMLRIFDKLCTMSDHKKELQKFPMGTYSNGKIKGNTEIVPRSILINRASMRGVFKPSQDQVTHKSAAEIASETLDLLIARGELVEMSLKQTKLPTTSQSVCIFSPRWAKLATEDKPFLPEEELKKRVVSQNKEKPHSGVVWTPPASNPPLLDTVTKSPQKPLLGANAAQETLSEQELIQEMLEAAKEGQLDDNVVFERPSKKIEL